MHKLFFTTPKQSLSAATWAQPYMLTLLFIRIEELVSTRDQLGTLY